MSVAELRDPAAPAGPVGTATERAPRRFSTRFFTSELMLIFGRRRNWVGGLILAAVPILIAIAVKANPPAGGDASNFLNQITGNGIFVALAALVLEMPLFLPIAVASIAGDSVAGEANGGTLRYLLTVPVGRLRLLFVKYAGIVVYALASTLVVALVGVLIGVILFGGGSMTLLSGNQISFIEGFLRVLAAALYLGAGMAALGAVGLFISTLTEQPIAATLATVVFSAASLIADQIPQIDVVHPYLLVHHWTSFSDLFRFPILWTGVTHGLYVDLAYVVIAFLAAWARFSIKDITS